MSTRLSSLIAIFTLIVMFGFPKAGVYLGNIPLTFGYVLLGVLAFLELARAATVRKRRLRPIFIWLGVLLLALAVLEMAMFRIYGRKSLGSMVSVMVSTIGMPVIAMLGTHWMIRVLGIDGLLKALRWALVPILLFGLISFVAYNAGGKILGVPFVTTTGADISQVAARHNLRGPVIKMFSTYNNGNILGINLLMWGPIAAFASVPCAIGFRSICVLTLSRSVWVGLFAFEFIGAIAEKSLTRIYRAMAGTIALLVIVIIASSCIGKDPVSFLLDRDLGGRVTNLQNDLEVISRQRIGWDSESIYAAAWLAFGPVGLTLMVCIWMLPIVMGGNSELQRVARLVLLVYMLIASVEGAFTLVPTQAVYWFVATIAMASPEMIGNKEVRSRESRQLPDRIGQQTPRWRRRPCTKGSLAASKRLEPERAP